MPGVRGVARLGEAFAVIPLVKRALPEARLPMQDVRTLGAMAGAAVAARALRRAGRARSSRETGVALISLAPAILALRGGELASYHGVEHKAIAAYEQDGETADAAKEHDRCGSNLVAPMLAATAAGSVPSARPGCEGPRPRASSRLGSMAVAVEVFGWSERHSETALAKALRRPGYEIQRAGRDARADARPDRGRAGRAGRDPAPRGGAGIGSRPYFRPIWTFVP